MARLTDLDIDKESLVDMGLKRELEQKVYLAWLGGLAHHVRTRKNGDAVTLASG